MANIFAQFNEKAYIKAKSPEVQRKRIESRIRNGNLKHTEESKKKIGQGVRSFYEFMGGCNR